MSEYVRCFVPKCPCKADGTIPSGPDAVYPICAPHAKAWQSSKHRLVILPQIAANHGRWGAEQILLKWSVTEAVGVPVEEWHLHHWEAAVD